MEWDSSPFVAEHEKKKGRKSWTCGLSVELPGQDSNLDKESQNLLCYRYTTG